MRKITPPSLPFLRRKNNYNLDYVPQNMNVTNAMRISYDINYRRIHQADFMSSYYFTHDKIELKFLAQLAPFFNTNHMQYNERRYGES